MIIGSFEEKGRPYVNAELFLPRLRLSGVVSFLVDTGSDSTILHPPDMARVGIRVSELRGKSGSRGIGGPGDAYPETARLLFEDADGVTPYFYRLDIDIAKPDANNQSLPSLLGRDILDCWYTECDPTNNLLRFTVRRTM